MDIDEPINFEENMKIRYLQEFKQVVFLKRPALNGFDPSTLRTWSEPSTTAVLTTNSTNYKLSVVIDAT